MLATLQVKLFTMQSSENLTRQYQRKIRCRSIQICSLTSICKCMGIQSAILPDCNFSFFSRRKYVSSFLQNAMQKKHPVTNIYIYTTIPAKIYSKRKYPSKLKIASQPSTIGLSALKAFEAEPPAMIEAIIIYCKALFAIILRWCVARPMPHTLQGQCAMHL